MIDLSKQEKSVDKLLLVLFQRFNKIDQLQVRLYAKPLMILFRTGMANLHEYRQIHLVSYFREE